MADRNVKLLFALFALSGFTGLIYESVWSHYLKLFLGAAAFAQSFVLAAFMGGMALGAWLASRWSARLKNLLAAYGWIEAAIGVAALVFHESYLLLTQFSLDQVLPALRSPWAVEIYKYSLCAVLIVPQTLLLGSSFHAFELMLSAFITGLALGGLWIRRRIDRLADPVRFAGLVQVFMGLAALATIFVYHWTFDWMAWVLGVLQRNDSAYPLFNLFGHALAFAVMLPATFLAGMTLPLFTHVLFRGVRGERAIGQVYAANTLGAIAGVLLAVHVLMPAVGLKLALVVGAAIDILLGTWVLRYSQAASRRIHAFAAVIVGMLAATATARAAILEPERLSSGG